MDSIHLRQFPTGILPNTQTVNHNLPIENPLTLRGFFLLILIKYDTINTNTIRHKMNIEKFLFLDFDGVMHTHGKKSFCRAQYFADIILKYPSVKVVFSTSWREYATLEQLKIHFPRSIHDRFVGMTPVLKESITHPRYREILIYNNNHGIANNQWLALDDMKSLFPPGCPNLILVNSKTGFAKQEARELQLKLALD